MAFAGTSAFAIPVSCHLFYTQEKLVTLLTPKFDSKEDFDSPKKIGNKNRFKRVRRFLFYIGSASTLYYSVQFFPLINYIAHSPYITDLQIKELQEKNFNPALIREVQFRNWQEAFKIENNRWPDPSKYPEDKEEYNAVLDRLNQIPDEKLKINFE